MPHPFLLNWLSDSTIHYVFTVSGITFSTPPPPYFINTIVCLKIYFTIYDKNKKQKILNIEDKELTYFLVFMPCIMCVSSQILRHLIVILRHCYFICSIFCQEILDFCHIYWFHYNLMYCYSDLTFLTLIYLVSVFWMSWTHNTTGCL